MLQNTFHTIPIVHKHIFMHLNSVICIVLLIILLPSNASAQQEKRKKDRFPSYFGLTVAPIFPSDFIGQKKTVFQDSTQRMESVFNQKAGLTFGASVRIGITKLISIETGLYQVRRNFDVSCNFPDSNIVSSSNLGFVNYDIPLNALMYVQLSEKWYMNAALGFSITHYPSDVLTQQELSPFLVAYRGMRVNRTYFGAGSGIGFEYRTKKSGAFYFGGSVKIPFNPIMIGVTDVERSLTSNKVRAVKRINGSYFSLELRYYLPSNLLKNNKQPNFNNGPIE